MILLDKNKCQYMIYFLFIYKVGKMCERKMYNSKLIVILFISHNHSKDS